MCGVMLLYLQYLHLVQDRYQDLYVHVFSGVVFSPANWCVGLNCLYLAYRGVRLFHKCIIDDDGDDAAGRRQARMTAITPAWMPDIPGDGDPVRNDLPEGATCTVCWERERRAVCVPCGHMYLCVSCARDTTPRQCAMCQRPLLAVIRLFAA
jgi:hypothetical protein